ncbi:DUF1330 domain-containing protein [Kineobactrum sediminis]|uniref:DUF1330 domain-containing protein n=1 Tax=Kineobactrum sediminis TaxID=1905677 RepID=A0A2N5XZL8_9GAMM|nr:DUF1330 domain-containing protein [Kineobactrum sediminis]PLW81573.1 DUF1330 domain-containing protein [Kineobactrum sediminis]
MAYYVDPTREQFDEFKSLPRDTPIFMLNLIRLNAEAHYPDGEQVTGAEAYARYGRESGPIFQGLGGSIVWRGKPECMVIGPTDKHWDIAFIARYPNSGAFMAMVTDEAYKKAVVHRQVAVKDSRLLRMGEAAAGDGFGG